MLDQGSPVYHVAMLPIVSRSHLTLPNARSSRAIKCSVLFPGSSRCSDTRFDAKVWKCPRILRLSSTSVPSASADSCRGLSLEDISRPGPVLVTVKGPAREGPGSRSPSAVYAIDAASVDGHVTHQTMHHRTIRISAPPAHPASLGQYPQERPPRAPQTTEKRMKVARVNASTPTRHALRGRGL